MSICLHSLFVCFWNCVHLFIHSPADVTLSQLLVTVYNISYVYAIGLICGHIPLSWHLAMLATDPFVHWFSVELRIARARTWEDPRTSAFFVVNLFAVYTITSANRWGEIWVEKPTPARWLWYLDHRPMYPRGKDFQFAAICGDSRALPFSAP